jgi:hypothetical protein
MRRNSRLLLTLELFVAAGFLLLAPVRVVAADSDQQAKAFTPSTGKAAIYVYRSSGSRMPKRLPITIDSKRLGVGKGGYSWLKGVAKGEFLWLEVEPGEHEVWVGWRDGHGPPAHAKIELITIRAQAGQSYFVRTHLAFDDKHEEVSSEIGKAEILACCKLIATVQSATPIFQ